MNVRHAMGTVMMAVVIAGSAALVRAQVLSSGIGVSGHWVIQVINADGSVASRTEFRNHLTADGAALLVRLVARSSTIGNWSLSVNGRPVQGSGQVGFTMNENTAQQRLTVAIEPNSGALRLSGEGRPAVAVDLRDVSTGIKECASSLNPADCARDVRPGTIRSFTATTLPSPIRVAANQTVQVQVDISFSPIG